MQSRYGRDVNRRRGGDRDFSLATVMVVAVAAFIGGVLLEPVLSSRWSQPQSAARVSTEQVDGVPPASRTAVAPEVDDAARSAAPQEPADPLVERTSPSAVTSPEKRMYWPAPVSSGDAVAVVAPGSAVVGGQLDRGIAALQKMGFIAKPGMNVRTNAGGRAGTIGQRAADLNRAIEDPSIRAIWLARGGSGAIDLLDRVNWMRYEQERAKPLIGYSDATVLQLALYERRGIISLSGPMVAEDYGFGATAGLSEKSRDELVRWLSLPERERIISNPDSTPVAIRRSGYGEGPLLGGNLSRVCMMLDRSAYCPDFTGAILVIEDINEGEASVRRMIRRLKSAGILDRVNGIILGSLRPCPDRAALDEIELALGDRRIPVVHNLAYGHLTGPRVTLPIGAWTSLDAEDDSARITVHPRRP